MTVILEINSFNTDEFTFSMNFTYRAFQFKLLA